MGVNKRMLIQHRLFKDIINPKDILSLKDMVKLQATLEQPKHTRIMLLSLPIRQLSILSKHTQARQVTSSKRTKHSHKDTLNLRIMEMQAKHILSLREPTKRTKNLQRLHK